ncbi:MAG: hypothetical protein EA364_11440 [Balneolaceae bacterium]|nr:MAG: hypothetical protein EA364_11440 [Balneolaceae bacterium]
MKTQIMQKRNFPILLFPILLIYCSEYCSIIGLRNIIANGYNSIYYVAIWDYAAESVAVQISVRQEKPIKKIKVFVPYQMVSKKLRKLCK